MRKITSLNYDWFFKENAEECDKNIGYIEGFNIVNIPHSNKEMPYNYFDLNDYKIVSSYKKQFDIHFNKECKYILRFYGVAQRSEYYINGIFIKENKCGYNKIDLDITKYLKDGKNEVYVLVDSSEGYFPPFGNVVDYLGYGGLYREVELIETSSIYLSNPFLYLERLVTNNLILHFKVEINEKDDYLVNLIIRDEDELLNKKFIYKSNTDIIFDGMQPILWDVNNPKLYSVIIQLINDNKVIDKIDFKYGFKYVEAKKDGFYLNGEKLLLRGLNRHQSFPYVGYAMPKSMQINDARILKYDLGLNIVRCSHYMQSQHFLNECDRIGLLVYEEFPGWQFIGDDNWKDQAIENLDSMILLDRNHPSIAFFGVRINESRDDFDFNLKCYERAKHLDPSKIITGTRNAAKGNFIDDCYTYNDFMNNNNPKRLLKKSKVTNINNPYLITEYLGHMYPNKPYDNEERRIEISIKHKEIINKISKMKNIMGGLGWVFADYNTHKEFGSGDMICHHGVLDMFRNPKLSSYTYSSLRKDPFLECSSDFSYGEYDASIIKAPIIYTNCKKVEFYRNDVLLQTIDVKDDSIDSHVFPLTDFYGEALKEKEHLSNRMIKKVKNATKYVLINGFKIKPSILIKTGIRGIKTTINMYTKYVANWGNETYKYKILGTTAEGEIKEITRGPSSFRDLEVGISRDYMIVDDTYDVIQVNIKALSKLGSVLRYLSIPISIETTDGLEVIGPKCISTYGGYASFYIKSVNRSASHEEIRIHYLENKEIIKNVEIILN